MQIENLKIGTRLGLGFGLQILLMLVLITVGLTRFASVGEASGNLIKKDWVKADAASIIDVTTQTNARLSVELLSAPDNAYRDKLRARIEGNKKTVAEAIETLEKLIYLPEGKELLARIKEQRARYVALLGEVGQLVVEEKIDEARRIMFDQTIPALAALEASVKSLADLQKKIALASGMRITQDIGTATTLMIGVGVAALLIGLFSARLITRSITMPMRQAVAIAQTVAAGDLTSSIETHAKDETGQLLSALKDMNDNLQKIVGEVRAVTDTVSVASGQIAAGNLDLSARTEEQASSLEETASSMEELASAVAHNADNARHANALASSASETALKGGNVVADMVETMGAINESSKKIVDIISVIDGIAFQTNILALNASVEAARAGEQGRGFAVVATEVRNLAQRSATAAREIKALIDTSVEKVDAGCRLVEQAGSTMDEIVVSVRRVTDIMGEIAAASSEQNTGIGQINQAIAQMDQVTQQNAALVEESAAAAESLEDKARSLARMVSMFKLNGAYAPVVSDALAPLQATARTQIAASAPVRRLAATRAA